MRLPYRCAVPAFWSYSRNAAKIALERMFFVICGAIAQLGERIVRNDEVVGSIPTSSTIFNRLQTHKIKSCHNLSHKSNRLAWELPQTSVLVTHPGGRP
jgi:hypothetical protein